jgi:hypothetical protein
MEIKDGANVVRNSPGGNIPANTSVTPASPIIFDGLNNDAQNIVDPKATKDLSWRLIVQPNPMADPGYVVPDDIETTKTLKVDNTNPILVNGAMSTISTDDLRKITS